MLQVASYDDTRQTLSPSFSTGVLGVSSNLLTAVTFYKDARLLQGSRPWLHILLALANVAVVSPSPLPASSSFSGRWLYGNFMCQLYAFEGMFAGIVAISAVIVLCVERYSVANSSKKKENSWFYLWSVLFALSNGFFWAVMPLLGWSRYDIEHTGVSCALDWKNPDESYVSFLVTMEIFSFFLPLMAAALCLYSACYAGTDKPAIPSTAASTSSSSKSAASDGQGRAEETSQVSAGFNESQLRTLCCIFLLFVSVGWGPFAFLCTKTMVSGSSGLSMLAGTIPPLACKLMVSAYPAAYAVTSARFRQTVLTILGLGEKKEE
ncbi:visual pigment-like receptor peropsin [Plakobranchus ocellatus]|uniref:Visual pigment-like receptor peropsin n=1 Tax=Plakobranchus ocellatus TaxID=259542 RepID=A0AAV3Y783_9GAST|nr:visual pigment-like receptor peropsin [Plakobranchus ocellatus]